MSVPTVAEAPAHMTHAYNKGRTYFSCTTPYALRNFRTNHIMFGLVQKPETDLAPFLRRVSSSYMLLPICSVVGCMFFVWLRIHSSPILFTSQRMMKMTSHDREQSVDSHLKSFCREVDLLASLSHPNVIAFVGAVFTRECLALGNFCVALHRRDERMKCLHTPAHTHTHTSTDTYKSWLSQCQFP